MKTTELTKHYWNEEGAYEKEFKELTNSLMPASGRAKYLVGEIVRAANRLYYEYCNNGNCNAREIVEGEYNEIECPCCGGIGYFGDDEDDVCDECDGSGYIYDEPDAEIRLSEFWGAFINIIRGALDKDGDKEGVAIMDSIESFITDYDSDRIDDYFSDENMHKYDSMIDHVAYYALKHADDKTEIPSDYKG